MQKLTLYALKADRDALLLALQKDGSVMLEPEAGSRTLPGAEAVSAQLDKTGAVLQFLVQNGAKNPLFPQKEKVSYPDFLKETREGKRLTEQLDTTASKIASLESEAAALRTQAESLEPWLQLDIPLEQLSFTETTHCHVGFLPDKELPAFQEGMQNLLADWKTYGEGQDGQALVVLAYNRDEEAVKHLLKEHDFSEAVLPKRSGTASQVQQELLQEAKEREDKIARLQQETKDTLPHKQQVELYYDQLSAAHDRLQNGGVETVSAFKVQGWVRKDRTQRVENVIRSVTDAYQLTFADPAEGEIPPTVLENSKLVEPYESVVELYSLPKAGSIDPDAIMAPFHFIFFGMMMSDAGYGLVLTLMLYIALKKFKPTGFARQLALVIFFGGISTTIWGAMFGGWFGLEWHPLLFVPMNEPLKMLALCFGLGSIHLITGMLIKTKMLLRDGDVMGAVCDQISWLIMFLGFFLMALVPGPIGKYLAWLGAGIIVLFGGRDRKGIISRLIGGLLSLYNISGYLSDLLSYSRIFALGLATGVIAMVINTVAQMLWSAGPVGIVAAILVLLAGHYFNIIINVLGAFVHSSRLQYIEFFGKFYEAGGRAFLPLALRTKYTDITK
ncbi:V-type ATP synthase subunit I [Acidaminococcus timonensis]|jgi:V/A-type H+-transporting ATPase subunit I|uniref:V-type ATP synthase subunit I n=1 Tax=Acidaminococcus timonensis TaxID=1871002 RepID=UPI0026F0B840|nr:V-type ATP synthase subunit I [Acidaminococcus timonensis]MDD6569100.1 V-type ATP synthase subunit I [Acidaminococcus sp.]